MGLIKAAVESLTGTLADQWKEAIHCPVMDQNTLLRKGEKMNPGRGSNTKGNSDIISNGSIINVEENTCMLTLDNGKITNIVSEPGQFIFDNSSAPSVFAGDIAEALKDVLKRFTFGGTASAQQRVVYINLMPLPGIPFGTNAPMPYFDMAYNTSINLRFHGTFEVQIADAEMAVRFYQNVAAKGVNAEGVVSRDQLFGGAAGEQYKREFMEAFEIALSQESARGVRYSQLAMNRRALTAEAKEATKDIWHPRGFTLVNVALGPVTLTKESEALLGDRLKADTMLGGDVQRAMMAGSAARAMEAAAGNSGGAMMGFMGMNTAMNMGGGMMNQFGPAPATTQEAQAAQQGGIPQPQPRPAPAAGGWTCSCGAANTGKFCAECGNAKPEPVGAWTCSCGAANTGKFCAECGTPRPAAASGWTCACGAQNTGRFCAECGKPQS